jgi:CMP/dCMP kinase
MRRLTIALDGPAGVGKSTVAKEVAQALDYRLVDTGAIYRVVALLAKRHGIAYDDDTKLAGLVKDLPISFRYENGINRVFLNGEDVSQVIRTEDISRSASNVSARPVVRDGLLALQRQLAGAGGAVLEGRDIGTVVCPQAEVKFFLDASVDERARRRFRELQEKGTEVNFEDVHRQVEQRDSQDRNRDVAPLRPAADAHLLDCTHLSIAEVVQTIVNVVKHKVND